MLSEKGHEVSVFINDTSVQNFEITAHQKIRIIRFNPSRTNSSSFLGHVTNISYEFADIVKEFIGKEGQPGIIEAQEYLGIAYYLLQYKQLLYDWCKDVPVLITMHSPSFLYMEYNHVSQYRYPNYWICEMERFCLQAADHIISPSQFMVDELEKRFELTNSELTIIANPFFAGGFFKPVEEKERPSQIVFYGKLTVQKGAFKLLEYFKNLWDNAFARPLYLLGGQDIVYHPEGKTMGDIIRTKYKAYIDQGLLQLENRIEPASVAKRLSKAEVVIIPSCNDNLPYVVFEMMALGKVLLVSKQGGQFEVIEDGKDGFVFDHEQPETFEVQLNKILQLNDDERKMIAQNAVKKVSSVYSLDTIYNQKIEVVNKLINKQKSRSAFPFIRQHSNEHFNIDYTSEGFEKGLLSIVIPYYNMGTYLDETVQSVLATNYSPKEIIIINDGSNEKESLESLNRYRNIAGIKVVDSVNKGLARTRNTGAEIANGEYLAFLDADDKIDSTYYSKAIKVLKHYDNVHFVGAWTKYFENSNAVWPTFTPEPPIILFHNTVNSSALVYKRTAFIAGGQNATNMMFQGLEDYESVIALLSKGYAGVVLPEVLFYYRVRHNSMIRAVSKNKKLLLYEYISKKHSAIYANFGAEVFNLLNANGPGYELDNPSLDYAVYLKNPLLNKFANKAVAIIKNNPRLKKAALGIYNKMKS
jgi:glycosyltransferase involved in cell wall biosynthesis